MNTRISNHWLRNFTNLKRKTDIFKRLLHLASSKLSEITIISSRHALGILSGKFRESLNWILGLNNSFSEVVNISLSLLKTSGDWFFSIGIIRISTFVMLLQEMSTSNLLGVHFSFFFSFIAWLIGIIIIVRFKIYYYIII